MALFPVAALLAGTDIGLGAQDMHWEAKGAFTGEVAGDMVAEFCKYVILGHSERRTYFGETDDTVNKKTIAAKDSNLIPIVCVGETLAEYEFRTNGGSGYPANTGRDLKGLDPDFARQVVIAYEPVWAIGTGKASSADNANMVIRETIRRPIGGNVRRSDSAGNASAIRRVCDGSKRCRVLWHARDRRGTGGRSEPEGGRIPSHRTCGCTTNLVTAHNHYNHRPKWFYPAEGNFEPGVKP